MYSEVQYSTVLMNISTMFCCISSSAPTSIGPIKKVIQDHSYPNHTRQMFVFPVPGMEILEAL